MPIFGKRLFCLFMDISNAKPPLGYKIAVLVFLQNQAGEQLLILRNKQPNKGNWSPIGGKLEMATGESPFECAARETREETGLETKPSDFHLFAMIAEKAYEGQSHWLIFLFRCNKLIEKVPPEIEEGHFAFHKREQIEQLPIPDTDRRALWEIWDKYRNGFVCLNADCGIPGALSIHIEQLTGCD